jgi:hypothetical protein
MQVPVDMTDTSLARPQSAIASGDVLQSLRAPKSRCLIRVWLYCTSHPLPLRSLKHTRCKHVSALCSMRAQRQAVQCIWPMMCIHQDAADLTEVGENSPSCLPPDSRSRHMTPTNTANAYHDDSCTVLVRIITGWTRKCSAANSGRSVFLLRAPMRSVNSNDTCMRSQHLEPSSACKRGSPGR